MIHTATYQKSEACNERGLYRQLLPHRRRFVRRFPEGLGVIVIKEALNRSNIQLGEVDEVLFDGILIAGLGQDIARQAALVLA